MKRSIVLLFASLTLTAAPVVKQVFVTATTAGFWVSAAGCTLTVSTSPTLSPAFPDTPDVGSARSDGHVPYVIGHNKESGGTSLALAADTTYYYQFSGCAGGSSAVLNFHTRKPPNSGLSQPIPFDSSRPWNWGFAHLLGVSSWVTDPVTGLQMLGVGQPTDWTWRTGAQPYGNPITTSGRAEAFNAGSGSGYSAGNGVAWYSGCTGWSNPLNISDQTGGFNSGIASNASTTNTNPCDLYGMFERFMTGQAADPWGGITYDDLGIVAYATATSLTGGLTGDPAFTVQLLKAGAPVGTAITLAAQTSSTIALIPGGSTNDGDGAFPTSFPTPFYSGWGLTAPLGPDYVNTQAPVTVSGSTLTIASPTRYAHFPSTMVPNVTKVWLSASSPGCTDNICTEASQTDQSTITLVETPSGTGAQTAIPLMWGVRVQKVNTNGTLTVGFGFKQAGAFAVSQAAAQTWELTGSPVNFTSGDGHVGELVDLQASLRFGDPVQYFVSSDGTIKPITVVNNPPVGAPSCFVCSYGTCNSTDRTSTGGSYLAPGAFDPNNAKTSWGYYTDGRGGSGHSMYKVVYGGDTTESLTYSFGMDQAFDGFIRNGTCDNLTFTNYTAPSATGGNKDLATQIATNFSSTYNSTIFGTFGSLSALHIGGCTGTKPYCSFDYFPGTVTQDVPAWVAEVDFSANPAVVTQLFNTADGVGSGGVSAWGGLHNDTTSSTVANSVGLSMHDIAANNAGVIQGGPYVATITDILDNTCAAYNATIALPWPIIGDNTYCHTCPAGPYAGTNNCVTMHIPVPCNAKPSSAETGNPSVFPVCPWDATKNENDVAPAAGMQFYDNALSKGGDTEHFQILSWNTSTNVVVALRNASPDYCCMTNTQGSQNTGLTCANTIADFNHAANFQIIMAAAQNNGCKGGGVLVNPLTNSFTNFSSRNQFAGHAGTFPGPSGNQLTVALSAYGPGPTVSNNYIQFTSRLGSTSVLPTVLTPLGQPGYGGYYLNIGSGSVQTYPSGTTNSATIVDTNSFNGNIGAGGAESTGGAICGSYTPSSVAGAPNVYTIPVCWNGTHGSITATQYKGQYLLATAGRYLLQDISGPSSAGQIDSTAYGFCYAYIAGECHSGSAAGTAYVNVPGLWASKSACEPAVSWAIIPCVVGGYPGGGMIRRQQWWHGDPLSTTSANLGSMMCSPLGYYPFSGDIILNDGLAAITPACPTEGWATMARLVKLPQYVEDGADRTQPANIPIVFPAGAGNFVRVRFGYARFGTSAQFYCSPRAEACNTSAATAGGAYSYDSEGQTATSTGGAATTVQVPGMWGNLMYAQPQVSATGTSGWVNYGDLQMIAVN